MGCDMCGEDKRLYVTLVEGVEMQLCDTCKIYGEVKRAIPSAKERVVNEKRQALREKESETAAKTVQLIVADYGKRIKQARENMRLTQEQLAKKLALKESQLHKFESGHLEPDNDTALRIEKYLHIKLLETYVEQGAKTTSSNEPSGPLTIADIIKQAKKK